MAPIHASMHAQKPSIVATFIVPTIFNPSFFAINQTSFPRGRFRILGRGSEHKGRSLKQGVWGGLCPQEAIGCFLFIALKMQDLRHIAIYLKKGT